MNSIEALNEVWGIERQASIKENLGEICWLAGKYHQETESGWGLLERDDLHTFQHYLSMFELLSEDLDRGAYWILRASLIDDNFGHRVMIRFKHVDDTWRVVHVEGELLPDEVKISRPEMVPQLNRVLELFLAYGKGYDDEIRNRLLFRRFKFSDDQL